MDWPSLAVAYFLVDWIVRIAFLVLIPTQTRPENARSWILLALFLPIPAAIAFGLIGRTKIPQWRQVRYDAFDEIEAGEGDTSENVDDQTSQLVRELGGYGRSTASHVQCIDDYESFIDILVDNIDRSCRIVMLQTYIFSDDPTGERILAALARASARGVACYVLFDALGSHRWANHVSRQLLEAGVSLQIAAAFRWSIRRWLRVDLRIHRKIYICDSTGYLGSQNLVARDFRPGVVNDELMLEVRGPIVNDLARQFRRDWFVESAKWLPPIEQSKLGAIPAQLMPSGPEYADGAFELLLVDLIHRARKRVAITTPYFIPEQSLLDAIRIACLRGIRIELFLSDVVDQVLVRLAQRSYYTELLTAGVKVQVYGRHLLHAKHVIVDDDVAYVGSSNVDIRSFRLNGEVGTVFQNAQVVAMLEKRLQVYRSQSRSLNAGDWSRRSPFRRAIENLARLLGPLL